MKTVRISDAEWEIMNVLWDHAPMTCSDLLARICTSREWHIRTVRTLLDRLLAKGAVRLLTRKRPSSYEAAVSRAECVQSESRSFVDRVFGGHTAPMLVHLVQQAELKPKEIQELRRILREKEE